MHHGNHTVLYAEKTEPLAKKFQAAKRYEVAFPGAPFILERPCETIRFALCKTDTKGEINMSMEKLAYAVWPWGVTEKEQMVKALKEVRDVGFTLFESTAATIDLFRDDLKGFQDIVNEYQVKPISFYFWCRGTKEENVETVRSSLDFLVANDIQRINIQASKKPGGHASPEELREALETLQEMGKVAKPYGIRPCIHPHANTTVMFEDEIDFVLQNTDPAEIGFGPDSAHLTVGLCDPVALTRKYIDRVGLTHLKDVRKNQDIGGDAGGTDAPEVFSGFLELGAGDVDIPGFVKVLEEGGYDGHLIIELDKAPSSDAESAAVNKAYMEKLGY